MWRGVIISVTECMNQWPVGDTPFNLFVQKLRDDCLKGFFEDSGAERGIEQCDHQTIPDLPDIGEGLVGGFTNLESCRAFILTNDSLRPTRV
jgi:hypothetical protein